MLVSSVLFLVSLISPLHFIIVIIISSINIIICHLKLIIIISYGENYYYIIGILESIYITVLYLNSE